MYSLIKNANRLNLPIDLQIELFNKTIKPILLYGADIWGFGNLNILERVQLNFLKHILKLKRSTPNYVVYVETGCMPLSLDIEARVIAFWSKLCTNDGIVHKLPTLVYKQTLLSTIGLDDDTFKKKYPWMYNVKTILIKCGLVNVWFDNIQTNFNWLKLAVKQKLKDLFLNEWYSKIDNSSNSMFYRVFKKTFGIEPYLAELGNQLLYYFIKFRTRNHRLPIETGNWLRTPINQRFCNICQDKIGDEFHYLFECPQFNDERNRFLKPIYYRRPNMFKLENLMCTKNKPEFIKLCKFVKCIIQKVRM